MKQGDLVRFRPQVQHPAVALDKRIYIVRWTEEKNNWVCVYGIEPPIQMSVMEVVSEAR